MSLWEDVPKLCNQFLFFSESIGVYSILVRMWVYIYLLVCGRTCCMLESVQPISLPMCIPSCVRFVFVERFL